VNTRILNASNPPARLMEKVNCDGVPHFKNNIKKDLPPMDLSNFSVSDLRALQENIKQQLKKREQQELTSAREQILAIAQSVGLPLSELINGIKRPQKEKTAVAVQYRHPDDATLQWTGRGRQPKWIKEWVDSGKSLDLVRI
jgi:DNA-binding protein H-NS